MTQTFFSLKEQALREEIILVGKLMYERGLIVAADGNISARVDEQAILVTPSGLCKGMMTPDQLITIDLAGRKIGPETAANRDLKPTSEITMHLEVYHQRPDVLAVVHAHPPHAIALSIAGISLADCMLPEAIVGLGLTPTTPYANPASEENARAIREVITGHDALVLERHGSLTVGRSPLDAFFRTETLEQIARITYMLRQLGGGQPLPPHQVEKLIQARRKLGLARTADEADFCEYCGVCHVNGEHIRPAMPPANSLETDLVHIITARVMRELNK
ncbi:MAG: class II aldolase/adducin family protein [Anaerolineae bacterium]|nr:class II aldolase/adducin family protein [Anaerolineae bacterium]